MAAKTILVVDDDSTVRNLLSDMLSSQGYKIFFAINGVEGVKAAKEVNPDLILLDIMMPEMDGFTVQVKLKEDKRTENIPVVFITAKTDLGDTMRALANGAVGYIEKPFDTRRLLRKVGSILSPNV